MNENSTVFMTHTDQGEVELMTRNFGVMSQARSAHQTRGQQTFRYSTGDSEKTVEGYVTWLVEEPAFRFAVMPR